MYAVPYILLCCQAALIKVPLDVPRELSSRIKLSFFCYRVIFCCIQERERAVTSLTEQLGIHQESHQELSASREASEREAGEKLEEWKWRAREAERERGEREVELEQSRDMERSLRCANRGMRPPVAITLSVVYLGALYWNAASNCSIHTRSYREHNRFGQQSNLYYHHTPIYYVGTSF